MMNAQSDTTRRPNKRHRKRRVRPRGHAKRRNLDKFVPRADSDFAFTAEHFARAIAADPEKHNLCQEDAAELTKTVAAYRKALALAIGAKTRGFGTIRDKDRARRKAEEIVRMYANVIRADPCVAKVDKMLLRIKQRPRKLKQRNCPKRPPVLRFLRSIDGIGHNAGVGNGSGVHVLEFRDVDDKLMPEGKNSRRAKPDGAVRLELFVDLIPVGENAGAVPKSPFDRVRAGRGWPWYLRSFTKSPMEVEFPLPAQPMLVVYWARWADATGDVSRFSKTCVARIEGWTPHANSLPSADQQTTIIEPREAPRLEARCVIMQLPYALPAGDEEVPRLHGECDRGVRPALPPE